MMGKTNYKILQNTNLLKEYTHLIFSSCLKRFEMGKIQGKLLPIIAFQNNRGIGLILTEIKPNKVGEVHSIFVKKDSRNSGIATKLLQITQHALRQQNIKHIDIVFQDSLIHLGQIKKILTKSEWLFPKTTVCNIKLDIKLIIESKWVQEKLNNNQESLFDWLDLTNNDISTIKDIQKQKDFPQHLTPFQVESQINNKASKGIRVDNKIIGWCIIHNIKHNTSQCSSIYIVPQYRTKHFDKLLIAFCIKDMIIENIDFTIFQIEYKNTFLIKYLNTLFSKQNSIVKQSHTIASRKILI